MVYKENVLKERELDTDKKKVLLAIFLNILIVFLQILFGFIANSISLITDAIHNFQDVIGLVITLLAIVIMSKKPSFEMTFGFLKAESMAAFLNSLTLIFTLTFILYQSILRLVNPEEVKGLYVIIFGFLGFLINLFSALILKNHHHHGHEEDHEDINIKSSYLHLLSDAFLSLSVVIGGIFIYLFNIYLIDPLLSIAFSLYIIKETVPVLKGSYRILIEGTPYNIDLKHLIDNIKRHVPEIVEIHDIHLWSLSSKDIYFSTHIVIKDISKSMDVLEKLENLLKEYNIGHSTIQIETTDKKCDIVH